MVSSGVYCTINDELQFFYTSGCLVLGQQQTQLDPLESAVFQTLAENPNKIISNDDLLDLWPTPATSPNSLTRVISTLRKKLRSLGLEGTEIKNYPKKGYALIAEVTHELVLADQGQDSRAPKLKSRELLASLFVLFAAFVIFQFIGNRSEVSTEHVPPVLSQAIQLLDDVYEKIDLSTNSQTDQIIYATRESEESNWYLVLMNTYSLETQKISFQNLNLRTPDWLDNQTLIFRAYNDNECSIKRLDLSRKNAGPVSLFPCNELTTGKGLSVVDSDTILFTDAALDIAPAYLYEGNVITGKVSRISAFETSGVGTYNIQSTQSSDMIAILNGSDWTSTDIHLIDRSKEWQSVWHINVPNHKFSVSWNGTSLIHTNDKGGVTAHLFEENSFVKSIEMSGFSKLYNIVGTGGYVAFLQGNMYRTNILISSLIEQHIPEMPIVDTRASNKLAQFNNASRISYISDVTGIEQLWSINTETQIRRQISTFKTSKLIEAIDFNEDYSLFAMEANQQISLYHLTGDKLAEEPVFSINGIQPLFF